MPTNRYFDNYTAANEQALLDDLMVEVIQVHGIDAWYIPRQINNQDELFGEDAISSYETPYLMEFYIKSVDGFTGDGNLLSKFGLEIRDTVTFTISRRVWEEEVGQLQDQSRPNEGDLVFFPLNKKIFQIKYVDHEAVGSFYQLGERYSYDLRCELFEYSNEVFNTGITDIDEIQTKWSTNLLDYALLTEDSYALQTENGDYIMLETYDEDTTQPLANNDEVDAEEDDILDFSEWNPLSDEGFGA